MNPSERIDQLIAELTGWRGQLISQLRQLIHEAALKDLIRTAVAYNVGAK